MIARILLCFAALVMPPFGGEPPWGLEQPVRISGEVHKGERFQAPIGEGLYLKLVPYEDYGWHIEVGPDLGTNAYVDDDYARCLTMPARGTTKMDIEAEHFRTDDNDAARPEPVTPGVGGKRWFDFVLDAEGLKIVCADLERALHDPSQPTDPRAADAFENGVISGRGWLAITAMTQGRRERDQPPTFESMRFDAEIALHGGLELWQLPGTYVLPEGFSGWVTIYQRMRDRPSLPRARDRYTLRIPRDGLVRTSTELRGDMLGARVISTSGRAIALRGSGRRIWGWGQGQNGCAPYHTFFVGTRAKFQRAPESPAGSEAAAIARCDGVIPRRSYR